MADGDYYAKNSTPAWRKVENTLLGGQEFGFVAQLATSAFAETMRLGNGAPGLNRMSCALSAAARDGDRDQWGTMVESMRREHHHHAHTETIALAGQALLENDGDRLRNMSHSAIADELSRATAERIAQQQLSKCRQGRSADDGAPVGELQRRERAVVERMDIAGLGREMLRAEDGRGFRAPARDTKPTGTEGLLGRTLVEPS